MDDVHMGQPECVKSRFIEISGEAATEHTNELK